METRIKESNRSDKAMTIVNLIKELIPKYCSFCLSYYKSNGTLYFNVKLKHFADCLVTPSDDGNYNIFIYDTHNMCQRTVLSQIDNIKPEDLCNTLKQTIEFLREEWNRWNKPEWKGSWWGYGELQRTE